VADGVPELALHADRAAELAQDAGNRSAHRLRRGQEATDEARTSLQLNPSEELLLEALASRLLRLLA